MSKMVIAIIAPASVLSISITCFILKEVIRRHDEEIVKVIASDVYDNIGNELVNAVMLSRGMANDTFLHQNLRAEDSFTVEEETRIVTEWLSTLRARLNCSSAFLASENSRHYWMTNVLVKRLDLENDPHDKWYKDLIESDKDYVLNVDTNEADNFTQGVFVNNKIIDANGNFLGVCGVGIDMKVLQEIIKLREKAYGIKVNLVNRQGVVQVDTEPDNIENPKLEEAILQHVTNQFILNKSDETYIVTKYIPELDWYLVVRRHGDDMQTAFSNVVFYMSIGFLIALIALPAFVQVSLKKGSLKIEESAKKHGIAGHAGLYVSMHLIDLKNDMIHELSRDPKVQLFLIDDGGNIGERIKKSSPGDDR